jgi:hypothetical protein
MNKINGSAIMKVSAVNPTTAHTRNRYAQFKKTNRTLGTFGFFRHTKPTLKKTKRA